MKRNNLTNPTPIKERKVFLNNMNSWFSNFIIETMRTEAASDPRTIKNEFMGTMNNSNMKLPYLFTPKITKINYNCHFEHEIFSNDVFIYNLEDADTAEIEYIIKGLKTLKYTNEKILIIVSNIMTWAKTTPKTVEEEVVTASAAHEGEELYTFENEGTSKKEIIVNLF
jgi:hypothetical protein